MILDLIREYRVYLQMLLIVLIFIGFLLAAYGLTAPETQDAAQSGRNALSTRTALALTSDALLGPFPTSTAPTPTASDTPAPTFTPTPTPTVTRTTTATPFAFTSFTPRVVSTRSTFTSTPRPTRTRTPVAPRPTNTRVPPSATQPPPPTNPPPPTDPPTYP